jgi:hypothetical protein
MICSSEQPIRNEDMSIKRKSIMTAFCKAKPSLELDSKSPERSLRIENKLSLNKRIQLLLNPSIPHITQF